MYVEGKRDVTTLSVCVCTQELGSSSVAPSHTRVCGKTPAIASHKGKKKVSQLPQYSRANKNKDPPASSLSTTLRHSYAKNAEAPRRSRIPYLFLHTEAWRPWYSNF